MSEYYKPTKIQMSSVVKGDDRYRRRYRFNPYIALLLGFLSMAGIVWLFIQIS